MPFVRLAGAFAQFPILGFAVEVPSFGEMASGDGLFQEMERGDEQLMLLLVDVTGHGLAAARTVALLSQRLLPDPRCAGLDPADLLDQLNGMLEQEFLSTGRFVVALALCVDAQGTVMAANAGQPSPHLGTPGSAWSQWDVPGGTPLGIDPTAAYSQGSMPVPAGQFLLAFTDGVSEAGAGRGDLFQNGGLASFLAGSIPGDTPQGITVRLLAALLAHAGGLWPEDDTTVLCMRHLGP
jgi:sigma-B regulation protein RsbU (phosphoserine phosphatase)